MTRFAANIVPGATIIDSGDVGDPMVLVLGVPDFTNGDREFLSPDPRRRARLRPLLSSEVRPWQEIGPAHRLLVCTHPDAPVYVLVRLPPSRRADTPANVDYAIGRLKKRDPRGAEIFRRALKGEPFGALREA
mgnify:CR=1 FL=1